MPARLLAAIFLPAFLFSRGFAADPAPVVQPTEMGSGKIKDESLGLQAGDRVASPMPS